MDVDGDGLDDIVYRNGAGNWQILFANGSGFDAAIDSMQSTGESETEVVDYDGDGRDDLAILTRDFNCPPTSGNPCSTLPPLRVLRSTGLKSLGNSFDLINTNVNYTNYPGIDLIDGGTAADVNGDGRTNLVIREGIRGGGDISYRTAVLRNSGGSFTRVSTSPTYDPAEARVFDYDGDGRTELTLFSDDSWRVLRWTGTNFQATDSGVGESVLKLADVNADGLQDAAVDSGGTITNDTAPVFPYLKSSTNTQGDLNTGALVSTTTTVNTSDDWGNLELITVNIKDELPSLVTWRFGRLMRSTVTQASDGESLTRVAEFGYDPATGILNKEVVESTAFPLTTNYGLDSFGNVNIETVSGPDIVTRFTKTDYNLPYGRFPETVTNEMGYVETRIYEPANGGIQSLTGPNQLTTLWTYDALGREASEARAGGTATYISYAWCTDCSSATAVYRIKTINTGAADVIEYFDSLNRRVLTQTENFRGNAFSNVVTQYSSLAQVFRVSRPYLSGALIYWSEYEYDVLGRVTKENSPVTGLNEIDYNKLTAISTRTVMRSDGSTTEITKETKDAWGLTRETVDASSNSATYGYDPAGNLETVNDSAGNTTTNIYDVRGVKTDTFDPTWATGTTTTMCWRSL